MVSPSGKQLVAMASGGGPRARKLPQRRGAFRHGRHDWRGSRAGATRGFEFAVERLVEREIHARREGESLVRREAGGGRPGADFHRVLPRGFFRSGVSAGRLEGILGRATDLRGGLGFREASPGRAARGRVGLRSGALPRLVARLESEHRGRGAVDVQPLELAERHAGPAFGDGLVLWLGNEIGGEGHGGGAAWLAAAAAGFCRPAALKTFPE